METYTNIKLHNYTKAIERRSIIPMKGTKYTHHTKKICTALLDTKFWKELSENIVFYPIKNIKLYKKHLEEKTTDLLDFISFGKFGIVSETFGARYHTYIIFETNDGEFILEKNIDGIHLKYAIDKKYHGHENISIPINNTEMCIFSMLCTMMDTYDDINSMYEYNAKKSNCQHFVHKFMQANGLSNHEVDKFILQNNEEFIEQFPEPIFSIFSGFRIS